jgi:hypothetical protein
MKKLLFLPFLALFFFLSPVSFAGGGPLGIDDVAPLKPFEQTKAFIVGVSIYTPNCDSIEVKGNLENTIDGDSVSTFTPPSDGTYIERHYFSGTPLNTWVKICKKYFKVTSATPQQRIFVAQAVVDGETAKATTPVSFGTDEYSMQLQMMERHYGITELDVISEKSLGGGKREVTVQWNKVPGVEKYAVYAREITTNEQQSEVGPFGQPLIITENNKATVHIASDLDFYLSSVACTNSACTPPQNPYETLVSRLQPGAGTSTIHPEEVAKTLPAVITPAANLDKDTMEKLNKKVAELENKLQKSEQKQNVLEEKLSQLMSFIKSLFPTFH